MATRQTALVCQHKPSRPHTRHVFIQEAVLEVIIARILQSVVCGELSPQFELSQKDTLERSWEQTLHKRLATLEATQTYYRLQIDELLTELGGSRDHKVAQVRALLSDSKSSLNHRVDSVALHRKQVLAGTHERLRTQIR